MENRNLYRGKSLLNGEWLQGHIIMLSPTHMAISNSFGKTMYGRFVEPNQHFMGSITVNGCVEVDPATVGQCTGLKGKNGTLIFADDIFKVVFGSVRWIAVVEWEKEGRFLGFTIEPERRIIYINREPLVEIIGNIHDNPELLKGHE